MNLKDKHALVVGMEASGKAACGFSCHRVLA